jgi:penicillin-binding protein 1C
MRPRALARGGEWSPLTLDPNGTAVVSRRVMSPQASFVVSDVLSDPAARVVTFGLGSHLETSFWTAVKTGTSEDMHDNWCIGFSRQYTVAVWVGNLEGDSMHDVSGVSGAGPIWHDVMAALQRGIASREPSPPQGMSARYTVFKPAVEPPRREWYLDGTADRLAQVTTVPDSARPRIASPANGMIIAIDPDIPSDHQRVLIAVQGALPTMRLELNDRPLGSAQTEQLWSPRPGAYHLTLEDRDGRPLDRIFFTVRGAAL